MTRKALIPLLLCGLLAAPASAQTGDRLSSSWARTNVCNASQLGARAQLAGDGSSVQMRVRFTAEWLSPDGWVPLAGAAVSPWQSAGSARYTWGQAGWTFDISVPSGFDYDLHTVAELQWGGGRSETRVTGTCSVSG